MCLFGLGHWWPNMSTEQAACHMMVHRDLVYRTMLCIEKLLQQDGHVKSKRWLDRKTKDSTVGVWLVKPLYRWRSWATAGENRWGHQRAVWQLSPRPRVFCQHQYRIYSGSAGLHDGDIWNLRHWRRRVNAMVVISSGDSRQHWIFSDYQECSLRMQESVMLDLLAWFIRRQGRKGSLHIWWVWFVYLVMTSVIWPWIRSSQI